MAKIRLFGVDIVVSEDDRHGRSSVPFTSDDQTQSSPPKKGHKLAGKRKHHILGEEKKRSVKNRVSDSAPEIPPELLRVVERREGVTEPVFLYQKKLEHSDTTKTHNRLFVNKRERLEKFLNEEESRIVNDTTKGLEKIVCVDARGNLYHLGLKIWPSLSQMVINSEWFKLVKENNVEHGDWIQIWGYRDMGRLCFAINFKRSPIS
ncbi:hypothetical protein ACS0TY_003177 [Phlomoides rotata]